MSVPLSAPSILAYSATSVAMDYVRGGVALALLAFIAAITDATLARLALAVTAAGCLWFLVRTRHRQKLRVELDAQGLLIEPGGSRLAWDDIDRLRLRWFGSPRTGKGWLELELWTPHAMLKVDSDLADFATLLAAAAAAARRRGLALDPATAANLAAAEPGTIRTRAGSSAPRG